MDPVTTSLVLMNTIAEIVKLAMEGQSPEVRAEFGRIQLEIAKIQLEDLKATREWWSRIGKPKET